MPSRRSPSQRTPEGRRGRQAAALIGGSNAGRLISASRAAEPGPSQPSRTRREVATFSHAGPADTTVSGPYAARDRTHLTALTVAASAPGADDSVLELQANGTSVGSVTLPAGEVFATASLASVAVAVGDLLSVVLTTVGTGLAGVTAHVDGIGV